MVIGGGDGVCATAGAGVVRQGEGYIYLGSSSWVGLAVDRPLPDHQMRTFTFVHLDHDKYSPCGPIQAGGGSYNWLRQLLYPADKLQQNLYELMDQEGEFQDVESRNIS